MAQHQMVQIVSFAITRTVMAIILRHSCSFQHLTTSFHQVPLFELGRLHFIARFAHSFLTVLQRNVQHVLLSHYSAPTHPPRFISPVLPPSPAFNFDPHTGFRGFGPFRARQPIDVPLWLGGAVVSCVIAAFYITNWPFVVQFSLIMLQLSSRKMAVAT
jgi:hypothetical protein